MSGRREVPRDPTGRLTTAPPVEERPPDPATILRDLRETYPLWGFLHDPGRRMWTAVRGGEHGITLRKTDPVALRLAVEEITR